MDEIDKSILKLLKENGKLSNKEIGEKIFLTGQAVGNRISNMIDKRIIEKFTISISEAYQETQFIRIFLKDPYFEKVENLINQFEDVQDFYKVRGQACYVVISHFSNDILNNFIESLSKYASYSVESVISNKKLS